MTTQAQTLFATLNNAADVIGLFTRVETAAASRDIEIQAGLCRACVIMHDSGNITIAAQVLEKVPAKRKTERELITAFFKKWAPVKFKDGEWTYDKSKRYADFSQTEKFNDMMASDWSEKPDDGKGNNKPKPYSLASALVSVQKKVLDVTKGYDLPADIKADIEALITKVTKLETDREAAAKAAKDQTANVTPAADVVDAAAAAASIAPVDGE